MQPAGTGSRAKVNGYRAGGKTGTVRKSVPGGYAEDRYIASFAGMAPLTSPRIVAVVVVDEPSGKDYYGGKVAAPVFAEITSGALRLLGIAPDDPEAIPGRIALGGTGRARPPAQRSSPPSAPVVSVAYESAGTKR